MSRIGKQPIDVPEGVEVKVQGTKISVQGPKGKLEKEFPEGIIVTVEKGQIVVACPNEEKKYQAFWGMSRSLIANMVEGVTKGFEKSLDITGVGYRAAKQGNKLVLTVGYSHPVEIEPGEGLEIEVPAPNKIVVKGIDKDKVGQLAANIRFVRSPEPYKGKGIRYSDEVVHIKPGKTGLKAAD
ncbi:MAG TPA: 50S ribosomal protein L6 [Clostridia bacterium]|jgi:large subunit ribosomal protein L6|nr:50S ribosomal protein L6 [Clostridia bacterium]HHY06182.1 50S ribosomal protein L6 [Clostridia bacterium]